MNQIIKLSLFAILALSSSEAFAASLCVAKDGGVKLFASAQKCPRGFKALDLAPFQTVTTLSGPQGAKGAPGATGPQGEKGEKGEKGEFGFQGMPGIQGEKGLKGDIGAQGIQGPNGAKGEQGIKGDQGVAGNALNFSTEVLNRCRGDSYSLVSSGGISANLTGGEGQLYRGVLYALCDANSFMWQYSTSPNPFSVAQSVGVELYYSDLGTEYSKVPTGIIVDYTSKSQSSSLYVNISCCPLGEAPVGSPTFSNVS